MYIDTASLYVSAHCWQELQEGSVLESDTWDAREARSLLFGLEGWLIEWTQPKSSPQARDRKRRLVDLIRGFKRALLHTQRRNAICSHRNLYNLNT